MTKAQKLGSKLNPLPSPGQKDRFSAKLRSRPPVSIGDNQRMTRLSVVGGIMNPTTVRIITSAPVPLGITLGVRLRGRGMNKQISKQEQDALALWSVEDDCPQVVRFTIPGQARTPQTGQKVVFSGGRSRLFPGKLYQQYKTAALWEIKLIKFPSTPHLPFTTVVKVSVQWYHQDKRTRDEDNLKKGLGDILKVSGLIRDDSTRWMLWGQCSHEIDRENPRCEVTIQEIK